MYNSRYRCNSSKGVMDRCNRCKGVIGVIEEKGVTGVIAVKPL